MSISLLTHSHHGFLVFSKPLQGILVTVCVDKLKCLLQILKKSIPCLWLMLPPKAMQMFTVCAAPEVILISLLPLRAVSRPKILPQLGSVLMYVDVPWLIETILKSISHATPGGHIDVNVLHCYPGQRLLSIVWFASACPVWLSGPTVAGGHVCALYSRQKTYGYSGSICPLIIKSKKTTFAVLLMITGAQLRKRDMKVFCDNQYTPKYPPQVIA